jgi:hypothetical protein
MSDTAIAQQHRRRVLDSAKILNEESFNVWGKPYGKAANICDLSCHDKGCHKLVKVCLETISKKEFDQFLAFDGCRDEPAIMQIFFWHQGEQRPFYRPKLRYNDPKQFIPADLQKLVK